MGVNFRSLFVGILLLQVIGVNGQDVEPTKKPLGRPDIPGTFVLEFGFNQPINKPDTFEIGFWGSRTFNIYYQHDLRLGKSKFSLHPGIGLGLERFKLKNYYTLGYEQDGLISTVELVPAWEDYPGTRKSMVVTNYLDIPIELRFSTNPEDPGRSFKASIGARFGYLFDSYTKVKYKTDSEVKKIKDKQGYYLSDFRSSAFVKVGGGNFALFCYYNLTPMFQKDLGPQKTEMSNITFGISLSSF